VYECADEKALILKPFNSMMSHFQSKLRRLFYGAFI
jgi:hypothetical protein